MKYYIKAIKNYAVFSGRATRMEFWMFMLFNLLIALALGFVIAFGLFALGYSDAEVNFASDVASTIYNLFILLPFISISVRRLHDMGKSGWWYLIGLIPVVGWAILLIMCMFDSEPFPNEYGESSKIGVVNVIYEGDEEVIELVEADIIE